MECLWRGGGSKLMEVECFAYCADEVFLYELLRISTLVQARFSQIKRYRPNLNSACKNTLHKLIFN